MLQHVRQCRNIGLRNNQFKFTQCTGIPRLARAAAAIAMLAWAVSAINAQPPTRPPAISEKELLPHSERMTVFGAEPADIGPGQRGPLGQFGSVNWEKPGNMSAEDYASYKLTWYLATNPWPYQGPGYLYLFPDRFPGPERKYNEVRVFAAPGEYEPASFCIWPENDLGLATVTVSDLSAEGGHSIAGSAIDVRIVKWLYMPLDIDNETRSVKSCVYQPLLLVHNDSLIQPAHLAKEGYTQGRNVLGLSPLDMADADHLLPFDLSKHHLRQLWLTVHVPEDAPAGEYRGQITVAAGGESVSLPMVVQVLAFKLSASRWPCWLYYAGGFRWIDESATIKGLGKQPDVTPMDKLRRGEPVVYDAWRKGRASYAHSWYKTDEQMVHELQDMAAHGVTNVAFYCPAEQATRVMEQAGFGDGRTFITVLEEAMKEQALGHIRSEGYSDIYNMCEDEPNHERLASIQRQSETRRAAGVISWTAMGANALGDKVVDVLDQPNFRTQFTGRALLAQWREKEKRTTVYGSPYPWLHRLALAFRVGYGLGMWQYGYGGSFDFAYQWHGPQPWDFFAIDTPGGYQLGYTLPTVGNPVPTLKWECLREANDDLRYLSTLLDHIEPRLAQNAEDEKAKAAAAFVDEVKTMQLVSDQRDLQGIRLKMVELILGLDD